MSAITGQESQFGFDELFFSRTDQRGIIQSGNSVFQRVSQYSWEELLLKPHSLIRHSAMPRAVFHLLWESLLAGNPIGAYVVNQSKDGSYYWVFALVTPVSEGFLSIRLKPSSPVFEIVKKKYEDLLAIEKSKKLAPHESQALLIAEIKKLGFRDYTQFMIEALTQELESRQIQLNLPPLPILEQLRRSLNCGNELQARSDEIAVSYKKSALVPLNLEVQAARLGSEGAPIATISSQYEEVAKEIQSEIQKFTQAMEMVHDRLNECQFSICNSILQKEMFEFFNKESANLPIDRFGEMELLKTLTRQGLSSGMEALRSIQREFLKFKSAYEDVRKLATALEIVNISGKIEAARIQQKNQELDGLLGDLAKFKDSLKNSLKQIDELGQSLLHETKVMQNEFAA